MNTFFIRYNFEGVLYFAAIFNRRGRSERGGKSGCNYAMLVKAF